MVRAISLRVLSLAVVGAVFVANSAAAATPRWHAPLRGGEITAAFNYDRTLPYRRGQRRGIDLRASAGTTVLAPCSGRVRFAGRPPGDGSLAVTIACGRLVATEIGLDRLSIRAGQHVMAGDRVGKLAAAGVLRLGARRDGDRLGYVDPAAMLAAPSRRLPPVAPRGRHLPRLPAPVPVRAGDGRLTTVRADHLTAAPAGGGVAVTVPTAILLGATVIAATVAVSVVVGRRRGRRRSVGSLLSSGRPVA